MSSTDKNDADQKDPLRPHEFDGIQEYDNQLPRWWLYMFYISIAFAAGYFYWYQLSGKGSGLVKSFENEQAALKLEQQLNAPKKKERTEDELLAIAKNPDVLKLGEAQFLGKCQSCHQADGGGLVGPNLTDDYWIHGNRMVDMVKVITEGVAAKGMPTWSALMSEDEIIAAAAYVKNLHGKPTKNPKNPEGSLVK